MWRVVDPWQRIGMHSHQPHEQQGLAQVLTLDLSMPPMSPKEDVQIYIHYMGHLLYQG